MICWPVNQSLTTWVSGSVSCQVPNGDLPIIGIQLAAFPRRVLMMPPMVVAAPPTAAVLPPSKNCSELTGTSKVCPGGAGEVQDDLLDPDVAQVGREVGGGDVELDGHRRRRLGRVVQVIPLVGQVVDEAVRPFLADLAAERLDDLGPVSGVGQGGVADGDLDVGQGAEVELVASQRHAELPLGGDAEFLERQQQAGLRVLG